MWEIPLEQRWAQRKSLGGVGYSHFDAEGEGAGAAGGEATEPPSQCCSDPGVGSKCPWALGLYSPFLSSHGTKN